MHSQVHVGDTAAVQVALGDQPVQRIPAEGVGLVVFIGQLLQAAIGVIAELHGIALGIGALFDPAAEVVLVAGGLLGGVGVAGELTGGVDFITVDAAVRAGALDQVAACIVPVADIFATGVVRRVSFSKVQLTI